MMAVDVHGIQTEFAAVDAALAQVVPALCPALQLTVRRNGRTVLQTTRGYLDPERQQQPVTAATRFDLASLTKLFAATAFMRLVEQRAVDLDKPVASVLPAFKGRRTVTPYEHPLQPGVMVDVPSAATTVDAGTVTFRHLLTHTAGLPPWLPLFRADSAAAARAMALQSNFACAPGEHVLYSDIGLIALGLALEELTSAPLQSVIDDEVLRPLGLSQTGFRVLDPSDCGPPAPNPATTAFAPTELCRWRSERVRGYVHDENCYRLDGVSAHAGLFSTANDVARFGQIFLEEGRPLLTNVSVAAMTAEQAVEGNLRRGLGFVCWSPEPESSGYVFSSRAFGHTGFTGTSLWIDPARNLVVALLTNEVYNGRTDRHIAAVRTHIHAAVMDSVTHSA